MSDRFLTVLVNGWWINVYQREDQVSFAYQVAPEEVASWHRHGWEDLYQASPHHAKRPSVSAASASASDQHADPDDRQLVRAHWRRQGYLFRDNAFDGTDFSDTDATCGSGDSWETSARRQADIGEIRARRHAEESSRDRYWEERRQADSGEIHDRRQFLQAVRDRYWQELLKRW